MGRERAANSRHAPNTEISLFDQCHCLGCHKACVESAVGTGHHKLTKTWARVRWPVVISFAGAGVC